MAYATVKHPTSGDVYAVELDESGAVVRAMGPLHHSDPTDTASLQDILDNQASGQTEDDAAWLRGELAR